MNRKVLLILVMGLVAPVVASAQVETKVKVIGQRINLRAKADPQSEVVGQVGDGVILLARSFQDQWVEVVPPDTIELWIHRDFIKDNAVTAPKLNYRAGPGINFSMMGTLYKGDKVTPIGEFGDWIKIKPPTGSSLWVSRQYVQVLEPEKAKPAMSETAPPMGAVRSVDTGKVRTVSAPVVSTIVSETENEGPKAVAQPEEPKAPADLQLIPLEGQGRLVQRDGILRPVGFIFGRPTRFRLVRYDDDRGVTICYVRGNNGQLKDFVGERLLIRGREYWIQGAQYPVVVPEQIVPRVTSE